MNYFVLVVCGALAVVCAVAIGMGVIGDVTVESTPPPPPPPVIAAVEDGGEGGAKTLAGAVGSAVRDPNRGNVRRMLERMATANAAERGRIIGEFKRRIEDLRVPLMEYLDGPDSRLLVPAIISVGLLRLPEAEPALQELLYNNDPLVRAASVRAHGYLGVVAAGDVEGFLADPHPTVVIAALKVASRLENPPAEAIIAKLASANHAVRDAAVNAVPEKLDDAEQTMLAEIALAGNAPATHSVIEVLRGLPETKKREGCLLLLAQSDDWTVRKESLRALALGKKPLMDSGPIWNIIEDPKTNVHEKLASFLVLEMTRTIDAPRICGVIGKVHPVAKIYAARCLVAVGDKVGLMALAGLLEVTEGPGVDDEDVACARKAARDLLTEFNGGKDLGSSAKWRQWVLSRRGLQPRKIKARPRYFW